MDAKEIKATLKNAREAIRTKDYREALRFCRDILTTDKNNYNALVFVGVATDGMDQPEQAVKAYKRAIESSSEQILAWQGLSGFYEKHTIHVYQEDLVNVYEKLIIFSKSDPDKQMDLQIKLARLLVNLEQNEKAVTLCDEIRESVNNRNMKQEVFKSIAEIVRPLENKKSTPENRELLLLIYKNLFEADHLEINDTERHLDAFMSLLMKCGDFEGLMRYTRQLLPHHPSSACLLRTLLVFQLDKVMGDKTPVNNPEMSDILGKAEQLESMTDPVTSSVYHAGQGYLLLCSRDYQKAIEHFSQGMLLPCSYYYMALAQNTIHDVNAIATCKKGLKFLKNSNGKAITTQAVSSFERHIKHLLVKCIYRNGSTKEICEAIELFKEMDLSIEQKALLGFLYLKDENIASAKECCIGNSENPDMLALSGWLAFHEEDLSAAETSLLSTNDLAPSNGDWQCMLGRVYWKMLQGTKQDTQGKCFAAFLKSAKLDPYNTESFLYLGHFYADVNKDKGKARKCYQKSFDLDRGNDAAGTMLCDILRENGAEGEILVLLKSVTSKATPGSAKWAWMRLGLSQMTQGDTAAAIASFQSVLRADPLDNHIWECLAEAYLQRGSYNAALRAFTKASELEPDSLYCLYQIASIKQAVQELAEAVTEYKVIIQKSPDYIPALKGIGETYLLLAKVHLREFFNGRAKDNCQEAISYLTRAAASRPDLSCLWKLLGDACTMLYPLAIHEDFRLQLPLKLLKKEKGQDDYSKVEVNKFELLQVGGRCYGHALKILPECATLWHDLGINFFHQSRQSSGEKSLQLVTQAVAALKKAISLDPKEHSHWTALGVVHSDPASYQPDIAQHCYVKSIELESNNVVAWTNLGTLYLKLDRITLAHEAFKMAQSMDPSYVACWVGQAMIAELVSDDEAMDLFRHTTQIGNQLEGALGYGHWVCGLLRDHSKHDTAAYQFCINHLAAIPAASDALAKYTDRVKTNARAYNMHGLLLEHQKLYTCAAEAFGRAVSLLEADADSIKENLLGARSNCARVLCAQGKYEAAISQYQAMESLDDFETLCGYGLALYKSGNLKESYAVYEKASEVAPTSSSRSQVDVALGMISYKFGDVDGAKTALFKGSLTSPASPRGLNALCALGLLQSDVDLATAALRELLKLEDKVAWQYEITWFGAIINIIQGNAMAAVRSIQKAIHINPDNHTLWRLLAAAILKFIPDFGLAAVSSAQHAYDLDFTIKYNSLLIALGEFAVDKNIHVDYHMLRSAQKSYHLHPGNHD